MVRQYQQEKMDERHLKIADYDYPLPDERIAKYPIERRDRSKLLVYRKGEVTQDVFCRLTDYLPKGALMVFNNTKVIQARIRFRKETGAQIEVFLLEPMLPADYEQMFQTKKRCSWVCLVGNLKKWKGETLCNDLSIKGQETVLKATFRGEQHTGFRIDFEWDGDFSFAEIIDSAGELPIPPYLNRDTEECDNTTYQTVYSKIMGSVAAPTAGLHFTDEVLAAIDRQGIDREELTLHVGAGTFKPVKSEEIADHEMHTEYISVRLQTIEKLMAHGGKAIAVGTTSVRTLESLYYIGVKLLCNPNLAPEQLQVEQWEPYMQKEANSGRPSVIEALKAIADYLRKNNMQTLHTATRIIIVPGYTYQLVQMLVTNFHQPRSTLLLLVSAFVKGDWRKIYNFALENNFRFLSYGDSSLLIP